MTCPGCGQHLGGLASFCPDCNDYVDNLAASTTDTTPAARERIPDDRSEAEIRMAIRTALEAHGFVVVDFEQGYRPDGSTRVRKGLADLYVMGFGVGVWRELKSARGRLTPEQRAFGDDCARCGIDWGVWRHESEAIRWAEQVKQGRAA